MKNIILTGDRPTGPLHIGHLTGSLLSRVARQDNHRQFILIADLQALTDNVGDGARVRDNILEVALDYLSVGIDPAKTHICLQSQLPALAELTMLYMNMVSVARLERNPTVRAEIAAKGFGRQIPAGFLCYPVSQAADITAFKATHVPVGDDQDPLIEQCNEIVRRVNRLSGREILPEATAVKSRMGRLPGIDGQAKMSKSLGNALSLSASPDEISKAVRMMFTDPDHLRVSDPGKVEGNVVFTCLDAFDPDQEELTRLKAQYRDGGLGDSVIKKRLDGILQEIIRPIRARRADLARDPEYVFRVLREGTQAAQETTAQTKKEVSEGLGLFNL